MKTIRYECDADGIATITFDEPGSPVNTMCRDWQQDLTAVTQQVVRDKDAIRGIILASAKTTFFAGADLKGLMRLQPSDAGAVFHEIEQNKKNFRTLETLGKPVVSCLNGAALGGGPSSAGGRPSPAQREVPERRGSARRATSTRTTIDSARGARW